MGIRVNGTEITDQAVEAEIPNHAGAASPVDEAIRFLAIRQIILDAARESGIDISDPERATAQLLESSIQVGTPSAEECRRHYEGNLSRFTVGELVEVSHILFQVTPSVELELLRRKAGDVLEQLRVNPESFAECAAQYSNCPSSQVGGSLGQLSRGDTVPEFERAIFGEHAPGLMGRVIETRFGLHIIRIDRCIPGRVLPFEAVESQIARALGDALADRAARDFVARLVASADLDGLVLEPGAGVLVADSHAHH